MKVRIFPGGFRVYPDDYVEPEVSPLMGYTFAMFAVTIFCLVATAFPVVSRLNGGTLAYTSCTLGQTTVIENAKGLKEHQIKIRFKTPDCGTYTYEGFDYNLSADQLQQKLDSFQGRLIEFSTQKIRILPTREHKTNQFSVEELDWRTWDISTLGK